MAITVREALTIGPLVHSAVLAGASGLDRVIKTVTVLEAPDSHEWIKGNELALTIGYMYKDKPELLAPLVEELARRGAASLGIKFKRYLSDVPQAVREKADRLGFPVLAIPYDCGWIDILKPLYHYLLDEETKRRYHAQQVNAHFIEILLKNKGLTPLLQSLSEMIMSPVAVFDANHEELARAFPPGRTPRGAPPEGPGLTYPIFLPKAKAGYLIVYAAGPITPLDTVTINQALTAIALEFLKEQAIREVERRYENQFLTDLLNGNFDSKEVVLRRAQVFGWNFAWGHIAVLVEIDQFNEYLLEHGNADVYRMRRDQLLELAKKEFSRRLPQAVVSDHGNRVLIIALGPKEAAPSKLKAQVTEAVAGLVAEVARVLTPFTASAGISAYYREITDLRCSYTEAKEALAFGRAFKGPGSVTCFDDLGVYRLLCNQSRERLAAFARQYLGPLLECQAKQKANLLETLRTYLRHGGNISAAAEAMYLHRRTLQYRLRKIQAILQVDLVDPVNRLNLSVAFMALALLDCKEA
ncbi:MAG TPA: PucR family transcriptional regulator [Firmicutes bacterium]|nr:PucR family transcriptional regulator [Bacillota bacterium]